MVKILRFYVNTGSSNLHKIVPQTRCFASFVFIFDFVVLSNQKRTDFVFNLVSLRMVVLIFNLFVAKDAITGATRWYKQERVQVYCAFLISPF